MRTSVVGSYRGRLEDEVGEGAAGVARASGAEDFVVRAGAALALAELGPRSWQALKRRTVAKRERRPLSTRATIP